MPTHIDNNGNLVDHRGWVRVTKQGLIDGYTPLAEPLLLELRQRYATYLEQYPNYSDLDLVHLADLDEIGELPPINKE